MARPVNARALLVSQARVKRRGASRVLTDLERAEPDLAEFVLESLTTLHYDLLGLGASARQARRIDESIEQLVAVIVLSHRIPPG